MDTHTIASELPTTDDHRASHPSGLSHLRYIHHERHEAAMHSIEEFFENFVVLMGLPATPKSVKPPVNQRPRI